jgi:type VII secretion-associated protein (TIGR03931 family)
MAARDGPVVVEIGSGGVRIHDSGRSPSAVSSAVQPESSPVSSAVSALFQAAMDWVDDPVALLDGRPVPTVEIWRELITAAAGARCSSLVVVYPSDWPQPRVRRVLSAAESVTAHVVAVTRDRWESDGARLRRSGMPAPSRTAVRRTVVATAVLAVGGAAMIGWHRPQPTPVAASLVEGRVAVLIPPDWIVERRTTGPGSPRVRVGSPDDPQAAVNITWSHAPGITLAETAASLREAAAAEPIGVFDFASTVGSGSRPAVAYRETRSGLVVRWTVLIDGSTRIAVGCQSAPGRAVTVLVPCLQAVRSAREAPF